MMEINSSNVRRRRAFAILSLCVNNIQCEQMTPELQTMSNQKKKTPAEDLTRFDCGLRRALSQT